MIVYEPYTKFNYNAVKKRPGNSVQSDAKLTYTDYQTARDKIEILKDYKS